MLIVVVNGEGAELQAACQQGRELLRQRRRAWIILVGLITVLNLKNYLLSGNVHAFRGHPQLRLRGMPVIAVTMLES